MDLDPIQHTVLSPVLAGGRAVCFGVVSGNLEIPGKEGNGWVEYGSMTTKGRGFSNTVFLLICLIVFTANLGCKKSLHAEQVAVAGNWNYFTFKLQTQ